MRGVVLVTCDQADDHDDPPRDDARRKHSVRAPGGDVNREMQGRVLTIRTLLAMLLVVAGGAALGPAPAANAATSKKVFAETLTVDGGAAPASVPPGQHTFAFTLTNDTRSPQAFGSARIGAPSGFTFDSTPISTGNAASSVALVNGSASGPLLMTTTGPTGSGVAPGAAVTISVVVTVPAAGACDVTWTTQVKQSNDFSGTGNDFVGNSVSTPVAGSSHLAWTTQPTDMQHDVAMSPAPAVTLYDPCGNADTSYNGLVTAQDSSSDPAGAQTFTATAVSGVATFSSLTYPTWGYDHLLVATAAAPGPSTCDVGATCRSSSFHVYQLKKVCSTNGSTPCSSGVLADSQDQTRVSIDSPAATSAAVLTVDVGGSPANAACSATTSEPPLGLLVTFNTARAKTVTMTLPKSYVNLIPNNGTPFMDICLQVPAGSEFVDKFRNPASTAGLLPDCSTARTTVCVTSRRKNAGNELITFTLPAGDPRAAWY
ncbi:MAG: hypothetical protein QOI82_3301 [Actinomycetota bacterium]|nr:hypothetical protein [Actinomycetota bacterium]